MTDPFLPFTQTDLFGGFLEDLLPTLALGHGMLDFEELQIEVESAALATTDLQLRDDLAAMSRLAAAFENVMFALDNVVELENVRRANS